MLKELHYYKRLNDQIYKYAIEFDEEELKSLSEEIKRNCGFFVLFSKIKKLHSSLLEIDYKGKKKKINKYGHDKNIVYTYLYPYLVDLINQLCQGNINIIDEIYNPKEDEYFEMLDKMKKITTMNDDETNKKISLYDYYDKVQSLINVRLEDKISIDETKRMKNFFDVEILDSYCFASNASIIKLKASLPRVRK